MGRGGPKDSMEFDREVEAGVIAAAILAVDRLKELVADHEPGSAEYIEAEAALDVLRTCLSMAAYRFVPPPLASLGDVERATRDAMLDSGEYEANALRDMPLYDAGKADELRRLRSELMKVADGE